VPTEVIEVISGAEDVSSNTKHAKIQAEIINSDANRLALSKRERASKESLLSNKVNHSLATSQKEKPGDSSGIESFAEQTEMTADAIREYAIAESSTMNAF